MGADTLTCFAVSDLYPKKSKSSSGFKLDFPIDIAALIDIIGVISRSGYLVSITFLSTKSISRNFELVPATTATVLRSREQVGAPIPIFPKSLSSVLVLMQCSWRF